jgi:hypothetical protein
VAFAKLSQTVRRSELLVLASLLAGLVMALFLMTVTWMTGEGLWAFPGLVAATAFRSLQAGGALSFSWPQIAAGFGLHLLVALVLGGVFAWTSPRLRSAAGLDDVAETPAFGLLGLSFGIGAFATAWWGVLPSANPLLVQGLDATFFAVAHGIWGLCLGVTRKAWNQTAPYASRRPQASPSPEPTPAASSHKAPSSSAGAAAAAETQASGVTTLTPEPDEGDDEAPDEDDEDEEEQTAVNRAGSNDELSPWPDPPEPDEGDDEETASDDGSPSSSSSSPSTTTSGAEDEGVAMTEHARRSLKGLTGEEPDLPPVHRQLDTTLTHVAPGRAVCTIDAASACTTRPAPSSRAC